jgi:hypothetical protein
MRCACVCVCVYVCVCARAHEHNRNAVLNYFNSSQGAACGQQRPTTIVPAVLAREHIQPGGLPNHVTCDWCRGHSCSATQRLRHSPWAIRSFIHSFIPAAVANMSKA